MAIQNALIKYSNTMRYEYENCEEGPNHHRSIFASGFEPSSILRGGPNPLGRRSQCSDITMRKVSVVVSFYSDVD